MGLTCGNSHGFWPFFKNTIILFVVPPKFCISIVFNFSWGEERPMSTHSLTSFVIVSLAAVFSIVTQRCGEERCVTILKTAARETSFVIELSSFNQVGIFFFSMLLIQALVKLPIDELSAVFLNVL